MANDTPKKPEIGQVSAEKAPDTKPEQLGIDTPPDLKVGKNPVINLAFDNTTDPGLEPPTPFDIPNPSEVVVSTQKVVEMMGKGKQELPAEKPVVPDKAESKKPEPLPTDKVDDDALRKEQESLLKSLDEKADAIKPAKPTKKAPAKQSAPKGKDDKKVAVDKSTAKVASASKEPPEPKEPEPPRDAPRSDQTEQIVFINHAELFPFKDHPFQVRDDEAMKSLVESVKERGVDQPAIVRPREGGGYELIAGHRRQKASELAGYTNVPCVVRNLTDDEAVLAMTESNFNQRSEILPSERAKALQMQLEAIKHQGARFEGIASGDVGKRSNEIVAERNQMKLTTVKRYIRLNDLAPELQKMVDEKRIAFTPAVELSYIKPKNQQYIAVAIEGQQSSPSLSQAQRMRELDQKKLLNPDVIDGIMLEEKKEVDDKVIISSQELGQYFGKEVTPREMKDQIMKLLDEWKGQHKELSKPEKQIEPEK